MASSSSPSSTPVGSTLTAVTDADIEKLLSREASAFQREVEVERILKAFKLNPYDIMDIDEYERSTVDTDDAGVPEDVKRKFKQLSLFIHPDKCPHPRAPEAFDLLKKAQADLSDKAKREDLDALVQQARVMVLKSLALPTTISNSDPALRNLDPPFKVRLRAQSKELLIEEEVRRRKAIKMNLANEGLEARMKEDVIALGKRKAEDEKQWEETRDQRVNSWRTFSKEKKMKKKPKIAILG